MLKGESFTPSWILFCTIRRTIINWEKRISDISISWLNHAVCCQTIISNVFSLSWNVKKGTLSKLSVIANFSVVKIIHENSMDETVAVIVPHAAAEHDILLWLMALKRGGAIFELTLDILPSLHLVKSIRCLI